MPGDMFTDHFFTNADGLRIHYRDYPAEGAETGVPVLCLPPKYVGDVPAKESSVHLLPNTAAMREVRESLAKGQSPDEFRLCT